MIEAPQGITNALGQFLCAEQSGRFDYPALGVQPFRLDRIEPGTFDRQGTPDESDATAAGFDLAVVVPYPVPYRLTAVPRGVVPNEHQCRLPTPGGFVAAPAEKGSGDRTDRSPVEKAQPDLVRLGEQQPIAGQRPLFRIVVRDRLLDQPQGLIRFRPGV